MNKLKIVIAALVLCAISGINFWNVTSTDNGCSLLKLADVEQIADGLEWNVSLIKFPNSRNYGWDIISNGWTKDEWAETKPCPQSYSYNYYGSNSTSDQASFTYQGTGASSGSSSSNSNAYGYSVNWGSQTPSPRIICHDGGNSNCDSQDCWAPSH